MRLEQSRKLIVTCKFIRMVLGLTSVSLVYVPINHRSGPIGWRAQIVEEAGDLAVKKQPAEDV
ncbi:hypothetical protein GCM10028825_52000 [Spirosoma agri]